MKIKNEQGEEVEVFTADEVSEKITSSVTEALNKYKEENPGSGEEITAIKTQVETLQTKLTDAEALLKAAENDPAKKAQVNRLREERDKAKSDFDSVVQKTEETINQKFDALTADLTSEYKGDILKSLSKGDSDLSKKIEFEFDRYRPGENSRVAIKERLERAYILATGEAVAPGMFDNGVASGGSGAGAGAANGKEVGKPSDNALALAKQLGIKPEEVEKHLQKKANNK